MLVESPENLDQVQSCLRSAKHAVAIDTETNRVKLDHDRFLVGISICVDGNPGFYIPVGHKEWITKPVNFWVDPEFFRSIPTNVPAIWHNAKFDMKVLWSAGIEAPKNFYDTMVMSHMLNENTDNDLDYCAETRLGKRKLVELANAMKDAGNENIPPFIMEPYAVQDCELTYELFCDFQSDWEFEELWEIERDFIVVLSKLEENGLIPDLDHCRSILDRGEARLHQIRRDLGFDPAKTGALHDYVFGKLGLQPLTFTSKKKPQIDRNFFDKVDHPGLAILKEYRAIQKVLSTYFRKYVEDVDLAGVYHPYFNPIGTVTGRLSSNMQQIPRDSDEHTEWHRAIKKSFLPKPGKQLWEIDYRNMEMRLAAVYGQQENMLEIFRREESIHELTMQLLGISKPDAKITNFLCLYNGGGEALSKKIGKPKPLCDGIVNSFWSTYRGIKRSADAAQAAAEENGEIKYWTGRKRHFAYRSEARKAFNSAIQGGCFEIVKRSMISLQNAGFDMCNQVHDSVWIHVDSEADVEEAQHLMEDWTEGVFGLRFSTDRKRLN